MRWAIKLDELTKLDRHVFATAIRYNLLIANDFSSFIVFYHDGNCKRIEHLPARPTQEKGHITLEKIQSRQSLA